MSVVDYFRKHLYLPLLVHHIAVVEYEARTKRSQRRSILQDDLSYQHGVALYKQHQYDLALLCFEACLLSGAQNKALFKYIGMCALKTGDICHGCDFSLEVMDANKAKTSLQQAVASTEDPRALYHLARAHCALQEWPEAVACLKEFIELLQNKSEIWVEKAQKKALKLLRRIEFACAEPELVHRQSVFPETRRDTLMRAQYLHPHARPEPIENKGNGILCHQTIPAGSHILCSPDSYCMFGRNDSDTNDDQMSMRYMAAFLVGLKRTMDGNVWVKEQVYTLGGASHDTNKVVQRYPFVLSQSERETLGHAADAIEATFINLSQGSLQLTQSQIDEYVELYKIVSTNAHWTKKGASALFPLGSRTNHSCCPSIANPVLDFASTVTGEPAYPTLSTAKGGMKMVGMSLVDIHAGQEITAQYLPLTEHWLVQERRQSLLDTWVFWPCMCPICSLQQGMREGKFATQMMHIEESARQMETQRKVCTQIQGLALTAEIAKEWENLEKGVTEQMTLLQLAIPKTMDSLWSYALTLVHQALNKPSTTIPDHLQTLILHIDTPTSLRALTYTIQALICPSVDLLAHDATTTASHLLETGKTKRAVEGLQRALEFRLTQYILAHAELRQDVPINSATLPLEAVGAAVEPLANTAEEICKLSRLLLDNNTAESFILESNLETWATIAKYYKRIYTCNPEE